MNVQSFASRTLAVAALAVAFALISCQPTFAQTKIEVEEEVRIHYLGDWHDGIVIDKNAKRQYMVEFMWAGSPQQKVFNRVDIRKLNEVDAMDFSRNWESSTGKFSVVAALKEIDGDKVVLIKPDLTEITVPLNRLCTRDNNYVKKLQKNNQRAVAGGYVPAKVAELPPLDNFGSGFGATGTFSAAAANDLQPVGALPAYLKEFKQAGVAFNLTRKKQKLVAVIPIGGPDQLVLMTAREDNFGNWGEEFQSQVYWVSMKQKKVLGSAAITPEHYVVDYNPVHKLLLTFKRKKWNKDEEPDNYTIWKLPINGTEAEPMVRWQAPGVSWAEDIFAKIVSDQIVVGKTKRHTYAAWNFVTKEEVYSVTSQSFFDAPVVISPNRKHLIVPEDGNVRVIDSTTGKTVMAPSVQDRHVSAANVNPAGTKLAALTERSVYVWNLDSESKEPEVHPAPLISSPFSSRIEWIGDDHILGETHSHRILYSLDLDLPVWSYKLDFSDWWLNRSPMKNMVVNGMFFYVARPGAFDTPVAIGAVNLPGPQVNEIVQNIDKETLYLMKPGVRVGITLGSVSDPARVRQWLIEKIQQNGWVHDDSSDIQMHAHMGVGKKQSVTYSSFGGGDETTVSFRPHFARLEIKQGELIIWQTGTSTGAPPIVHGNRIQAKINSYQQPQLGFFQHVKIEDRILDPKYSRGFGLSLLGRRGIEVLSTSPPGREDDPAEAERKAQEERQKNADEQRNNNQGGGNPPNFR